jgi:G3E family GTPase
VEQIAFADQIVLNKTELVDADELRTIESRLRSINPLAPVHRAQRADVDLDKVLGRGAFDLGRLASLEAAPGHADGGHRHDADCHHRHHHDGDIESISLSATTPMDGERISDWLNALVAARGVDILRAKGIIDVSGEDRRLVFQAVHMLLEGDYQRCWRPGEKRFTRMVFIGRHLDRAALQAGLDACTADMLEQAGA